MLLDALVEQGDKQKILDHLGYAAGYCGDSTRVRVEQLYGAVHPVFGSVKRGRPSPAQCLELGKRAGRSGKMEMFQMPPGCTTYYELDDHLEPLRAPEAEELFDDPPKRSKEQRSPKKDKEAEPPEPG